MTYFFRGIHFATILIKTCLTCFMDTDPGFSIAKLKSNPSTVFKVPDSSAYPSQINESLAQINLEHQEGNCFVCKYALMALNQSCLENNLLNKCWYSLHETVHCPLSCAVQLQNMIRCRDFFQRIYNLSFLSLSCQSFLSTTIPIAVSGQ